MTIKQFICRTLVPGAAIVAMGFAMPASAKTKPKNSGGFSVGCLLNDSTLQGEEGLSSSDPPAVVTISPARLWPPNHKLKNMSISMSPAANSSSVVDVSLTITNITDDQITDDDAGDAGCGPATSLQGADWSPADFGSLTASGSVQNTTDAVSIPGVQLRGERCAMDGTRTYAVSVTCCDITNGNVCDSTPEVLDVTVPKSRKPAVTSAHQS